MRWNATAKTHAAAAVIPLLAVLWYVFYKETAFSEEEQSPHGEKLSSLSKNVIIPGGEYKGRKLWSVVREVEEEYLANFRNLTVDGWKTKRELEEWLRDSTYTDDMYKIRAGLQRVRNRRTNVWPAGYREIRCDLCTYWHSAFRFDHLHPRLQFLGHLPICFRGNATQLILNIRLISDWKTTKAGFRRALTDAIAFAQHLKKALDDLETGLSGNDLAARPMIEHLVACNCTMIQNSAGLRLRDVVLFLTRTLHSHMLQWRKIVQESLESKEQWKRDKWLADQVLFEHNTVGAWRVHMERYEDVVMIWDTAVAAVDVIMSGNKAWRPLLSVNKDGGTVVNVNEEDCRCPGTIGPLW